MIQARLADTCTGLTLFTHNTMADPTNMAGGCPCPLATFPIYIMMATRRRPLATGMEYHHS